MCFAGSSDQTEADATGVDFMKKTTQLRKWVASLCALTLLCFSVTRVSADCTSPDPLKILESWLISYYHTVSPLMESSTLPEFSQTSSTMAKLAQTIEEHAGAKSHSECAKFVKNGLIRMHIISPMERPSGDGWEVGLELVRAGKAVSIPLDSRGLPIGCNSLFDVPAGTILTYKRLNVPRCRHVRYPNAGHVEVRTRSGFGSDYRSQCPVTGSDGLVEGQCHVLTGAYLPIQQL